jgi:WD40 repeat protein
MSVLRFADGALRPMLRFHPDGSRLFLVVAEEDGFESLLAWPLTEEGGREPEVLLRGVDLSLSRIAVDPRGRFLVVGSSEGAHKIPLDGGAPTLLGGVARVGVLSFDPSGRYLASRWWDGMTVLDLDTGELYTPEVPGEGDVSRAVFDAQGWLLVARGGVLSRWEPATGAVEVIADEKTHWASPVGQSGLLYVRNGEDMATSTRSILNLENGSLTPLPAAHQPPGGISFDPTGSIVASGHPDGEVRVGRLFDDDPHILLGHEAGDTYALVSPDGGSIASLGGDGTVRLWPMPDLDEAPFHTLQHAELLARLEALTNLRAVPDETSHTGYTIDADFDAYHGWAELPRW